MSRACVLLALVLVIPMSAGQDKKKDKTEPRIVLLLPLGAEAGTTTRVTIRGFRLDQGKEVQVSSGGTAKILSKGPAPVPDKNPDQVGDTQIVADVTLPAKIEADVLITVATSEGNTRPQPLLVEGKRAVVAEKEPNPGFRPSQEIKLPVVIEGVIGMPRDVDVFRFQGKKGQKVRAEVRANRFGSPLDAMLTLYGERAVEIASADDFKGSRDALLEATLPADGVYFLSLIDAHDTGSALHVYRLLVE